MVFCEHPLDYASLFSLQGKVIVITGAAGLLGRHHAEIVASAGGIPILLDIAFEKLGEFAQYLHTAYDVPVASYQVDITNEEEVVANCAKVYEQFGRIDGLINNAANNPKVENNQQNFSRLENFAVSMWNSDIAVGLTGAFLCAKHYGQVLVKHAGSIVNISSDLGLIAPDQRLYYQKGLSDNQQPVKPVTYSVVKSGLIGLTRYLSTYWASLGVRCNALCPGGVENSQDAEFIRKVCSHIPLGRLARPNEYQGAILFLLSNASSYMNGSIISIDGGRVVW